MLVKSFINHQWKQTKRSTIFQKSIAINIIIGFFILLIFVEFLVAGIVIGDKWHTFFPDDDPISKF